MTTSYLNEDRVIQIINSGKRDQIDWFPEDVSRNTLGETLVAMANSNGGEILIGISPRSGKVIGLRNPDEIVEQIFQVAMEIEPTLVLPVPKVIPMGKAQVIYFLVPSGLPLVYHLGGRYLGRNRGRNEALTGRNLRKLFFERGNFAFESDVPEGASVDDLDESQIQAYLQTIDVFGEELWEESLLKRGCLKFAENRYLPTYAGILLFGKYPQQWLPSATILAVRFQSEDMSDRFLKNEISGSLVHQLQIANTFILENMSREIQITGLEHQVVLEYPYDSVREVLVNAVAHRDYHLRGDSIHINLFIDRMEIHSPGVLPGPVNISNLLEARYSRNPVIMQVLADFGFGERIGYGLDRVVATLRDAGFPPPVFEEIAGTFRVTLRKRVESERTFSVSEQLKGLEINSRQKALIHFLVENRRVTNREYQELCPEVHPETLRRDLADLVNKKFLVKIGDKKATYYVLKSLPR